MDVSTINTQDLSSYREKFRKYIDDNSQKPKSTNHIVVMVYKNRWDFKNGKQVLLTEVIDGIRTESERLEVSDKKYLPVAYFTATEIIGRKLNENIVQHSGLIILDIDKDDNPGVDFIQLKKDLKADKYTCACFNSPSGGIKVVVNTNINSVEYHDAYFHSIKEYFLTHYTITKIDPSGCNVARACYLPYDSDCYYKSPSYRYCLDINQINTIYANSNIKQSSNQSKVLLEVGSISLDEHYDNLKNLLKKWTEVGLYANIFNIYRYKNIERGVMSTDVPFLEFIIAMNTYPYRLDWSTRLDEIYFTKNPQKPISTDYIDGLDGMEVCEIVLPKTHVIKERFRAKTLGSITMKLIFNNPFCHVDYLINAVKKINFYYCEDPHPFHNPKPDDIEVQKIVMDNYKKFLDGELDFSTVIRKKIKKDKISKKYVFWSRKYEPIDNQTKHLEATRTYHEGRNARNYKKFAEAIYALQNGKKIMNKRIAEYIGVSSKTIGRYRRSNPELDKMITMYNATI